LFRRLPCFSPREKDDNLEKATSGAMTGDPANGEDSPAEEALTKYDAMAEASMGQEEDDGPNMTSDEPAEQASTNADPMDRSASDREGQAMDELTEGMEGIVHLRDEEIEPSEGSILAVGEVDPGNTGAMSDEAILGTSTEGAVEGPSPDGEVVMDEDSGIQNSPVEVSQMMMDPISGEGAFRDSEGLEQEIPETAQSTRAQMNSVNGMEWESVDDEEAPQGSPDAEDDQVVSLVTSTRTLSRVQEIQERLLAADAAAAAEPRLVKTRSTLAHDVVRPSDTSESTHEYASPTPLTEETKTRSRIQEIQASLIAKDEQAKLEPRMDKGPSLTLATPIYTM